MAKIHERWTVLPHGPLVELEPGLLTVVGDMPLPLGSFPRRMTVVRLASGGSIVFSAMALREPEMARLEAFGRPQVMVVPSGFHRIDARIWKQRYPAIRVVAPGGARRRVEQVVPVDPDNDLADPEVSFAAVVGTGGQESALVVARPHGTSLIVNDVIGHVRHPHGIGGKLVGRLVGYSGRGPAVPRTVAWFLVKDRAALAGQFRDWARLPRLQRIIMSHGEPITADPVGVLHRLADELG